MKSFKSIVAVLMFALPGLLLFCGPAAANETKYSDTISQVIVQATNAQSLANQASTFTKITFATEIADTRSEFATNKFTAKSAGLYYVGANASFTASDNGTRSIAIYKNGAATEIAETVPSRASAPAIKISISGIVKLAATDYLELFARQNSGGAITMDNSTELYITRIH